MNNILKEFAYGNLNPNNGIIVKGTHYETVVNTIAKTEEKLLSLLDGEQKDLLIQFSSAQSEANAISNTDKFIDGYRLGVLMTMEVFKSDTSSSYNTVGNAYE